MAWIAKNDPSWDKYLTQNDELHPDPDGPDPQHEAAKRGDKYALMLEMEYLASLTDSLSHKIEVLQRAIHDLRDGLERHSTPHTSGDPVDGEYVSGGLRVPASVRDECDRPPTTEQ